MTNLIEAKEISKKYGGRDVVKKINVDIRDNEIVALIGPNGAGKTTTISMLLGIIKPDSGSISYWCENYKSHIGAQLQSTPFFEGYTAVENLSLFAALYDTKLSKNQLLQKLEEFGLEDAGKTPAIKLSLGQQKRLAIAVTTIHHPVLTVLDEPTSGLDPRGSADIRKLILNLRKAGGTVLFSSHDMDEVSKTADRVLFIANGQVIADGAPNVLLDDYKSKDFEELYLTLTDNSIGGEQ